MFFYLYLLFCFIWNQLFGIHDWWNTAFKGLYAFLTNDATFESALFGTISSRPIWLPLFALFIPLCLRKVAALISRTHGPERVSGLTHLSRSWLHCYSRQFIFRSLLLHLLPYLSILTFTSASIAIWHVAAVPLVVYHIFVALL